MSGFLTNSGFNRIKSENFAEKKKIKFGIVSFFWFMQNSKLKKCNRQ